MSRIIGTEEFNVEVMNSDGLKVVDFFATWCGPCKMLAPVFDEVSLDIEEAEFLKVDIDQSLDVAREYQVSTVPTIIIFKDGEEIERLVGFKTKQELEAKVKSHI